MIEEIINAISNMLYSIFGADYKIYADNSIEQGLKNPCFFISVLNPSQKNYLGDRKLRKNPFMIQYFPKTENDNIEMLSVAESLLENMEFISLSNGNLIKGSNLHYEIVDGILHFKINYNVFINKSKESEKMESLEMRGF